VGGYIKMDLKRIGWKGMDWINLRQGQIVGSCEHSNEHSGFIKCGIFLD
jgi:hypothetical protein